MRCLSCHYDLSNLTEPRCPECGRAFDPNDPSTFSVARRRLRTWWLYVIAVDLACYFGLFLFHLISLATKPLPTFMAYPGGTMTFTRPPMSSMASLAATMAFEEWILWQGAALFLLAILLVAFRRPETRGTLTSDL